MAWHVSIFIGGTMYGLACVISLFKSAPHIHKHGRLN